jgi:hypothetical protein
VLFKSIEKLAAPHLPGADAKAALERRGKIRCAAVARQKRGLAHADALGFERDARGLQATSAQIVEHRAASGLFALYVLSTAPQYFQRYWAASPSLWFDEARTLSRLLARMKKNRPSA